MRNMRDFEECEVCKIHFREWHIDDPLHSTNWSLPNRRTADVCSVACQQILIDEYNLNQRKMQQQTRKRHTDMRNAIEWVNTLIHAKLITNSSDNEIETLYYAIREAVNVRERMEYDE